MSTMGISLPMLARALRFVSEVRDLPRGSTEQRLHFLGGLAELLGARVAISVRLKTRARGLTLADPIDVGWDSERERAVFHSYLDRQDASPDPTLPSLMRIDEPIFARTRGELTDDRTWYHSAHVQDLRKSADVDHCILGGRREHDTWEAFSLHRPWGDPAFTPDDCRVVEVIHGAAAPYLAAPKPLPPRLAKVLDALCRGLSEKQAALELGLSPHTVHDYIKALHRRFGVQSRAELVVKALSDR